MGILFDGMIENPVVAVKTRGQTPLGRFHNFFGYGIFKELGTEEWVTLDLEEIVDVFIEGIRAWQVACEKSYETDCRRWLYQQGFWTVIKLHLQGKARLEYPTFNFLLEHTRIKCREFSDWAVEAKKPVEYIAKPLQVAQLLKDHANA